MSAIERIKTAVSELSDEEFLKFRKWFDEYASDMWDKQIERDAKAGKFDKLAADALQERARRKSKA